MVGIMGALSAYQGIKSLFADKAANPAAVPAAPANGNIFTNHQYLSSLGVGAAVYAFTGDKSDAAIMTYGTHEVLTGDANILEKGALAWVAGDLAEKAALAVGAGGLTAKFANWATTIGTYVVADNISDSVEVSRSQRPAPAPAPALALAR